MDIVKPVGYDVTTPDRRDLPAWYLTLMPCTLKPCFVVSKYEDMESSFYYVTAPDKNLWDPVFSTITEAVDFLRCYDTDFYLDDSCGGREQGPSWTGRIMGASRLFDAALHGSRNTLPASTFLTRRTIRHPVTL